ncbi:MAG: hypothetical protein WBM91_09855 [Eudoraea sp.]|uniref:hypothetical protein n=1 Tax=Eudoraea sp. TaxID=1979955 RepID=UPI0035F88D85
MARKTIASTSLLYKDVPIATIARGIKIHLHQNLGKQKSTFLPILMMSAGCSF